MLCNFRPKFPYAGNRRIVSRASLKPVDTRTHYGFRGVEVRLTDFQVNDAAALTLQLIGPTQHFEGSLTPDALHSFCDSAVRNELHSANSLSKENDHKV